MEGNNLKPWTKWKLVIPDTLTKEELDLKIKYAKLKDVKQKLARLEMTGKCHSPVRNERSTDCLKKFTSQRQDEINSKKTCDFKKPSKQQSRSVTKRSLPGYSFEDDTKPRSIIIKGHDLTESFLRSVFDKFGFIWKIRTNEDKTSSVLSFKRPSSAKMAAESINGNVVNGLQLKVSLSKPKNNSWCNVSPSCNSSGMSQFVNKGRSVHLAITGYLDTKDIEEFFQCVGRITRIYLNSKKKYGFVTFENEEQAQRAMREMNGEIYKGVKVIVSPQIFCVSDAVKACDTASSDKRKMVLFDELKLD